MLRRTVPGLALGCQGQLKPFYRTWTEEFVRSDDIKSLSKIPRDKHGLVRFCENPAAAEELVANIQAKGELMQRGANRYLPKHAKKPLLPATEDELWQ